MPDKRTIIVLGALVMGMTLTSVLLLVLEPGPVAPLSGVTLQSIDSAVDPADQLFDISRPLDWQAIVIHDSGAQTGSSQSIHAIHDQLGRGGLGYHFVINNGSEEADGEVEVGFRWQRQYIGAYLDGDGAEWFHRHAIGICLIGDLDGQPPTTAQVRELVWLVQQLQQRFDIPREAVYLQVGSGRPGVAAQFPTAAFRRQLFNATSR